MGSNRGEKMVQTKGPNTGSLVPAKRRSVKKMMFDCIAKGMASLLCPPRPTRERTTVAENVGYEKC